MLDGIKSKLGFAGGNAPQYDEGYDQEPYDEGYGEYGDYGDDYGEGYEEFADYGPDYDGGAQGGSYEPYTPVTTRAAGGAASRRSARTEPSMPKLVSIDDVRAHTQLPESLSRDPLPPRRVSSASATRRFAERTMVDSSLPPSMTPEGTQAAAAAANAPSARRERSEGLNSLFEPTDAGRGDAAGARGGRAASSAALPPRRRRRGVPGGRGDGRVRPLRGYAGGASASFSASRSCTVLKPASYAEVSAWQVLKAGDVVVLALRNTPDSLAKRVLDSHSAFRARSMRTWSAWPTRCSSSPAARASPMPRRCPCATRGCCRMSAGLNDMAEARIALIGGGKMGEAIMGGWMSADAAPAGALSARKLRGGQPGGERRAYLQERYGVACVADAREIDRADVVVLAVKPQVMMGVLESIAHLPAYEGGSGGPLFVSIAAGLSTARLQAALPPGARLVRTMPNTPLLVGAGVTAVVGGSAATHDDVELVRSLFSCLGTACVVEEDAIDAVGALSGSGPAYVAAFVEALRDAGAACGLDPALAESLAFETCGARRADGAHGAGRRNHARGGVQPGRVHARGACGHGAGRLRAGGGSGP